jgi:hypothetical protein
MTADLHIDYETHLGCGRVWRVEVEIPLKDAPEDVPPFLDVTVDVIAPNRDLAQYIAATMFPEYSSISIHDEPLRPSNSSVQTSTT